MQDLDYPALAQAVIWTAIMDLKRDSLAGRQKALAFLAADSEDDWEDLWLWARLAGADPAAISRWARHYAATGEGFPNTRLQRHPGLSVRSLRRRNQRQRDHLVHPVQPANMPGVH